MRHIISNEEIAEIQSCLIKEDEAAQHIESALTLLSNKEVDQSRESVAQSISAVEATAKRVAGKGSATLAMLCNPKYSLVQHDQFRQALLNLYNYTSGEEGIRHSLTDKSQPVSKALARFMLVTCSAFVNLIRSEAEASLNNLQENAS